MTYRIDLDPVWTDNRAWMANVEATTPEPRVLLRNHQGNLDHCMREISDAITRHTLNPWSAHSAADIPRVWRGDEGDEAP